MAECLRSFISHRAGQARHWHRSLHLTWVLDNWDGATGCWQHWCVPCPLVLAQLHRTPVPGCPAGFAGSPDVGLATAGQGSISLSQGREMQGWGNQTCAVSPSPLADIPQKPKERAQSSFAQMKNKPPVGKGEPRGIPAANSEAMGGHTSILQPLRAIVPQQ